MEQEDRKTGRFEDGSDEVIAACIEVHRHLGPGLLESAYELCLARELSLRMIRFERQRAVPVSYKGVQLVLTCLKLTGLPVALLVNFNAATLKLGLRRLTRKTQPHLAVFPSSC